MNINEYGQVSFNVHEIIEHLYSDNNTCNFVDDQKEITKHNEFANHFEIDKIVSLEKPTENVIEFHNRLADTWNIPEQYQQLDLEKFLAQKMQSLNLKNQSYVETLSAELVEFKKRNMVKLLLFLIYLLDVCKQNNVVTGVGRGSSVASLVLYLIGVHHIDPIKYNLNYKEFLR